MIPENEFYNLIKEDTKRKSDEIDSCSRLQEVEDKVYTAEYEVLPKNEGYTNVGILVGCIL